MGEASELIAVFAHRAEARVEIGRQIGVGLLELFRQVEERLERLVEQVDVGIDGILQRLRRAVDTHRREAVRLREGGRSGVGIAGTQQHVGEAEASRRGEAGDDRIHAPSETEATEKTLPRTVVVPAGDMDVHGRFLRDAHRLGNLPGIDVGAQEDDHPTLSTAFGDLLLHVVEGVLLGCVFQPIGEDDERVLDAGLLHTVRERRHDGVQERRERAGLVLVFLEQLDLGDLAVTENVETLAVPLDQLEGGVAGDRVGLELAEVGIDAFHDGVLPLRHRTAAIDSLTDFVPLTRLIGHADLLVVWLSNCGGSMPRD